MPQNDPEFYNQALRRIKRFILIIGAAGAVALTFWKGLSTGSGFLIGAAASYVSFWRWERVVDAVAAKPVRRSTWFFVLRFALLILAAYVIIKVTRVNQAAALAGLLVPAAASVVEITYELIYGTRT